MTTATSNVRRAISPQELSALLSRLLGMAEQKLGARDSNVSIHPTQFSTNGPCLMNTQDGGAFIQLSFNSLTYLPTTVFEMAHEVVHLLNPTTGYTNWLEEGIAVAFSLQAQGELEHKPFEVEPGAYLEALELVESLPDGPFEFGRKARDLAGSLNAVTFEHLKAIAPELKDDVLHKLASKCAPRQI